MDLYFTAYLTLLFAVLTPGVLLTLPKKGSKLMVAAVHGIVFAVVYYFTAPLIVNMGAQTEGFVLTAAEKRAAAAAAAAARRDSRMAQVTAAKDVGNRPLAIKLAQKWGFATEPV